MSNGVTSAFISVFGLSATALAHNDDERLLTYWVLEHDQGRIGHGAAGFALSDLPFTLEDFQEQRSFLAAAVAEISGCAEWETLPYPPDPAVLLPHAHEFAHLLDRLAEPHLNRVEAEAWRAALAQDEPAMTGFPTCPLHHILLTVHGCHACNSAA